MDIVFVSKKLQKQCASSKLMVRAWGSIQAEKLRQRLDDLHAAVNLGVMATLPGRCHELKGDRSGQLSLDLKHPYRLILEPADSPIPQKDDGGLDWDAVQSVRILSVEDTHG